MKGYYRTFLLILLMTAAPVATAQSYRLDSLSEQLATQANELAERSYEEFTNSIVTDRDDVEALHLAQQFSASASVFRRLVNDRRRDSELRDSAAILSELGRRAERDYARRSQWSDVQRT